ncbi:MAG: hypothetical protein IPM79_38405 [Polyangiaceae bacterium]|nr:hypothetical protein [Polyangiaceae bacterium]MBK8943321.1 hypothetical protein [Polyangiaceae bacterium]
MKAGVILPLALLLASASTAGCRTRYVPIYAHEVGANERVHVRVNEAHVRGDRVVVKTWVHNQSDKPMVVHRDDLALRLADGTVVQGVTGKRSSRPVVIAPGKARVLRVGFDAPGGAELKTARLVMSGVEFGTSGPRTLGEIGMSRKVSTFLLNPDSAAQPAAEPVAGPAAGPAAEPAAEAGVESEPAAVETEEEDDAELEEPSEPEVDEPWQIGGG